VQNWLGSAAILLLAPKCLVCVAAYAGLGTLLGLGGRELCGGSPGSLGPWATWLPVAGLALGAAGSIVWLRRGTGVPAPDSE
jgi:hypothetical protein